jgi:hypothetical protein
MVDGPEEYLLMNPLNAMHLENGNTVIQDSYKNVFNLHYYDSAGTHLVNASRWGEGPWEFHYLSGLHRLPGDSLFALGETGRFAVFGPGGERVREGRLPIQTHLPVLRSFMAGADEILLERPVLPETSGLPQTGISRGKAHYLRHSISSSATDTLGTMLPEPAFFQNMGNRAAVFPVPFAPSAQVAACWDYFWLGQSDIPEIYGFHAADGLTTILRLEDPRRRVTRRDRQAYEKRLMEGLSGDRLREHERYARRMEYPETMPSFGMLEGDLSGNLWVQRYTPPRSDEEEVWDVFDSSGKRLATVTVPPEVYPACARRMKYPCDWIREIGPDYLLVDQGTRGDIRQVVRYRILK